MGVGKALANDRRQTGRRNRVLFTSYLMEKGYTDTTWLASFWDMSTSTVRDYKKEAKHKDLAEEDRQRIQEIMEEQDCDLPQAVMIYYNNLMSPDSACFIATASYGTEIHAEIDILRDFRDQVLLENKPGERIVSLYYRFSPYIADRINSEKKSGKMVRMLLKPVIKITDSFLEFKNDKNGS